MEIDPQELLASFAERRSEADPRAQQVLDEFIRAAEHLSADAHAWREIMELEESWRDSLSDSQVIRNLRALVPRNGVQRPRRRPQNSRASHSRG
jgi:hypothetical protein